MKKNIVLMCTSFILVCFVISCSKGTRTLQGYLKEHTRLGDEWFKKQQYRYAVTEYKNVLEFSPYYAPALLGMARVNEKVGKYEKAIEFLRTACDNDLYNSEVFLALTNVYMKMGRYDKADEVLLEAITYSPKVAEYYFTRGIIYEEMGILEQAAQLYKKATELDSKLGVAYVNLANVLQMLKQYKLAKKYLDLAVQMGYTAPEELRARIEKNLSLQVNTNKTKQNGEMHK